MTVMAERTSQMSVQEFEKIASTAPETVTLEFINGRIGVKKVAGEWADPAGVLMAVEVTSYDSDTDRRDRHEKPTAYGQAGIPLYLLIDRDSCTLTVHSGPDRRIGGYRDVHTSKFGEKVALPGPMGIELDTEILENYVR
ncbi:MULTISPECIES: Uma2 family endonuclease [Streptomyces]|uniref:Uma2 family endonuclease n=1 Tax=Streptomyces TaxID=1883 RepID=UPI001674A952|nr:MULTISPECIES: Uma2 family endonuclease [Streptomyces]MBK3523308.1 Uma2 family endonuclease [Streptomyces sp. MBT70]GGR69499.1 hypothetical protein GCM10010236_24720 [Streptomyces eurythermus]